MKNMPSNHCVLNQRTTGAHQPVWTRLAARLGLVLLVGGVLASSAWAQQTVVIKPITMNYWAGVNTSTVLGPGSNSVTMTGADGIATVALSVAGQPVGLTTTLSTNSITNSIAYVGLSLAVTNVAAGAYPLILNASGAASYSTNVNFFVVPQWIQTNKTYGSWSDSTNWSSGSVPVAADGIYFDHSVPAPFTNVVDVSQTFQSLFYLGDADDSGYANAVNTTINSGATLSILGTNGFFIGRKNIAGARPFYTFNGAGTLLVSNAAANFGVIDGNANASRYLTVNMTNLNNLSVYVNRFAAGDTSLSGQQGAYYGGQMVNFQLSRTNVIKALFTDNYTNVDFNTAIQYERGDSFMNGAQNCSLGLGISNAFYADSIGVGRGGSVGSSGGAFGVLAYPMRFANGFSNSVAPYASALFRNADGVSPVSLLALGVDSGTRTSVNNNRGFADFRGGRVDMLVDQIWLGQNRTNCSAKDAIGGLYFDWGTINANTVVAGNMKYTNIASAITGYLMVGTNGTMIVNKNLILGQTPAVVAGFEGQAAAVSGQVQINNGGTLRANQISIGQFSSNNVITVNQGGLLLVSNTIGSAAGSLTTLSLSGAQLTFSVIPGVTNAYVTNLNTTTTASRINIAAAPAGESTNVLIVYQAANQVPNIGIGTLPPGFNNMQILVDNVAKTVSLVISTNQPQNLAWRGTENSQWDHTSMNWLDLSLGTAAKFVDGDSVTFDDTAAVPTSITITDTINPGQSGVGITVSNNLNNFVFNATGAGLIGSGTLVKLGSRSLQMNVATSVGAQLNEGTLTVGSGASIGNATTATGTTLNVVGTVSGGVTCAGNLVNSGTIVGNLSLQTSASAVNSGTLSGPLSMQAGSALNNSGSLNSIGTATVATNATLINSGVIYGTSLTVAPGGTLTDTVLGSPSRDPGSINVGTLAISGTFNPGGDVIGTTKVTDIDINGNLVGSPNGRIQLNAGSTTVFKIDVANTQPNTKLLSLSQIFGPSATAKAINGGTLVLTNIGATPFAAGQTFKLFGSYISDGNIGNAGLNSTNVYPIVKPATPGSGLAWDLGQLYPNGTIGVISAASVQIMLTNNVAFYNGTNIVTQLDWPAEFTGYGWVQQQISALTNGLGTNWNNVGASDYVNTILLTNTITADQAVFYRFVRP